MIRPAVLFILVCLALTPLALAGTSEDPEVTDAAGDCAFAPGNQYMDIVSAWISDETSTDFNVNIQLAAWNAALGEGSGFAVQFTHQQVEFGVLAGYFGQTWGFGNGRVSESEVEAYNETTGSFQADPPVLTILFTKSNFPHTDPNDNQLVDFNGGSIDLKPLEPFFFVPAPLPAYPDAIGCDEVVGTKPYTFKSGSHSMADMTETSNGSTTSTPSEDAEVDDDVAPAAAPTPTPAASVPAPGLMLVLVAGILGIALRGRRA